MAWSRDSKVAAAWPSLSACFRLRSLFNHPLPSEDGKTALKATQTCDRAPGFSCPRCHRYEHRAGTHVRESLPG